MKIKLFSFLIVFFASVYSFAQVPQKFNYQGVARNSSGNPIINTTIGLRLSITDGTNALYSETFTPTTSALGLFQAEVGNGNVVSGTFAGIDWLGGARSLKVELDPAGGNNYIDMGSSPLISVPYALVAGKVDNMMMNDLVDVNTSGAVTNQVLQWNGTEWVPANISTGSGDNWGSQDVVTNFTLSGNGTSANPLALASQGAGNGQVLMWNGISWSPSYINGDNWGASVVNTSPEFTGNGTPANPLLLSQQSASNGNVLEWSGIGWSPGVDDTLNLPYDGNINTSNTAFSVQNTGSGTGIRGVNASGQPNSVGVVGLIQGTNPGIGTMGVMGVNVGTNSNGFGVYGLHQGSGVGVYGSAAMGGVGMWGTSATTGGVGVLGSGSLTGVKGTSNSATGYGIHGVALSGGYGGMFEGRTAIVSNSNGFEPNLLITETETNDYARLRFTNSTPNQFWEMDFINTGVANTEIFNLWNGMNGVVLTVKGNGNLGIVNSNPTERLDVNGNVKFSGALMPNNSAGTSGQVLKSNGPGVAPGWVSSTNALFSNTYLFDLTAAPVTYTTGDQLLTFNGFTDMNFTITGNSKVLVNFNIPVVSSFTGSGDSKVRFTIQLRDNLNNLINQAFLYIDLRDDKVTSAVFTHHCFLASAGTYKVNVVVAVPSGNPGLLLSTFPGEQAQINLQVIPQ